MANSVLDTEDKPSPFQFVRHSQTDACTLTKFSQWSLCPDKLSCTRFLYVKPELIILFACSLERYTYRQQRGNCLMIVTSLNPEDLSQ